MVFIFDSCSAIRNDLENMLNRIWFGCKWLKSQNNWWKSRPIWFFSQMTQGWSGSSTIIHPGSPCLMFYHSREALPTQVLPTGGCSGCSPHSHNRTGRKERNEEHFISLYEYCSLVSYTSADIPLAVSGETLSIPVCHRRAGPCMLSRNNPEKGGQLFSAQSQEPQDSGLFDLLI